MVEQARFEPVQVDVGVRVDSVRSEPGAGQARSFTPVSASLGALWSIDEAWRLSVRLDRAARAPAEEELFANGPHIATAAFEIGDTELTKERALQGEVGVHFHGQRFEAKAALHQNRSDQFIYLRDTGEFEPGYGDEPLPIRQWTQDDARFRGAEIEAIAHLVNDDRGRLDRRLFTDTVRATLQGGGNVPRIAPARWGTELRWSADAWRLALGAIRYARQDDVAVGEEATPGYTLVHLSAAYHLDVNEQAWEVFVERRNLTDEVARVHTSFLEDRVFLPARNVTLGARVFF